MRNKLRCELSIITANHFRWKFPVVISWMLFIVMLTVNWSHKELGKKTKNKSWINRGEIVVPSSALLHNNTVSLLHTEHTACRAFHVWSCVQSTRVTGRAEGKEISQSNYIASQHGPVLCTASDTWILWYPNRYIAATNYFLGLSNLWLSYHNNKWYDINKSSF